MINYNDFNNLNNKIVYVVGGSGLIGKEIVKALTFTKAKTILVLDIKNNIADLKKNNKNLFYENFNLTNLKSLKRNISKLVGKYGIPDCYVNCSYPKTKDWSNNTFNKIKLNSLNKNVEIHMNSFIWLAKVVAEKMILNNKGSIVQFASIYGILGQDINLYKNTKIRENFIYPAIKGGIINSAKSLAAYYGRYNVRVNVISPGGVFDKQDIKFYNKYSYKTPLKRMATPKDIPGSVIFLFSDASNYITGINLLVDGGWSSI